MYILIIKFSLLLHKSQDGDSGIINQTEIREQLEKWKRKEEKKKTGRGVAEGGGG